MEHNNKFRTIVYIDFEGNQANSHLVPIERN